MLKNYWKTAVRSLLRHRFFSAINIFGLAVSMTICMAIIMLVADQMMYDRYNTNRDRIYRITSTPFSSDGLPYSETSTTTLPVQSELMENYTGVEKSVKILRGFANNWLEFEQNVNIPVSGYFADPGFLDFFQVELEYGDTKTALMDPYTVVLTKAAAKKLFRQENPVGEMLRISEKEVYKVTGVIRETKNKSHIVFDALASMATVKSMEAAGTRGKELDNWFSSSEGWVYIMVEEGKTASDIQQSLDKLQNKHFAKVENPETQQKVEYHLQAMMDITPGPFISNPIGPFLPWVFVYIFAGLAGIVMMTSCFNFTNLSIARSLTRAREIGIRKVTGAMRWQIFTQFLSESVIVALFSLGLASALIMILKPLILNLSLVRIMKWDLEQNLYVYGFFVLFALFVGILAGLFPAVVLSGFQPVKVLKSITSLKLFSRMGLRKVLLTAQFTFSLIFILTLIVVFHQLKLFAQADHGFTMNNRIVIQLNHTDAQTLKTELLKYGNVESVTASSHIPAAGTAMGADFKRSFTDKDWAMLFYYSVDEDYLKNMGLTLVAGKFFDPNAAVSNKNFIVINEKALKQFHFGSNEEAIGQEIIMKKDSSRKQIIGVVKNYNHQLLMENLAPLGLLYAPDKLQVLQVAYTGPFAGGGKTVETAWSKVNPSLKVDYKDMSSEIHRMYNILFGDAGDVLTLISFLAIVISCLGLLGMATYSMETRRKEISIRKILGSESGALIFLLSKGFFIILLSAVLIGVPSAYLINSFWLESMANHVSVDLTVILTGVSILIIFGIVTIGSQTWRATFVNPVDHLKGE